MQIVTNVLLIAMVAIAMLHASTLQAATFVLATEPSQEMGKIVQVSECNLERTSYAKTIRVNVGGYL